MTEEQIADIVKEAVEIEREFVCDALPVDLIGMNGRLMSQVRRGSWGGLACAAAGSA